MKPPRASTVQKSTTNKPPKVEQSLDISHGLSQLKLTKELPTGPVETSDVALSATDQRVSAVANKVSPKPKGTDAQMLKYVPSVPAIFQAIRSKLVQLQRKDLTTKVSIQSTVRAASFILTFFWLARSTSSIISFWEIK